MFVPLLNSPAYALYAFTALLLAMLLVRPVMWFCRRTGWVDKPDARKKHSGAIPLSGGLLILLTVLITALITRTDTYPVPFVAASLLVFAIGYWDDRFPLPARTRFICHLGAAALLVFSNETVVHSLGQSFGPTPIALGSLAIPFTLVAVPGVINAFNMIDGADGLSGGQLLISLLWLVVVAAVIPTGAPGQFASETFGPVLLPVIGALIAFLAFNMRAPWRNRAAMFLGDSGSMMLGLCVVWVIIELTNRYGEAGLGAASALWIIAIPLFDMFSSILRRIAEGRAPMSPDRKHMHHLLIAKGLSVSVAVLIINTAALLAGAIGVLSWRLQLPQYYLFWVLVMVFITYTVYAHRYWQTHELSLAARRELFKVAPNRG